MKIVCLDLEGVLVPEIWINFAERTGISELRRTTRDEPDYDKLMKFRIDLLQSVFYCFVFRKRVPGEMIRHMNVSGFEHSWCLRQKQAC